MVADPSAYVYLQFYARYTTYFCMQTVNIGVRPYMSHLYKTPPFISTIAH